MSEYLPDTVEQAAASAVADALGFMPRGVFVAQPPLTTPLPELHVFVWVEGAKQESKWKTRAGAALIALRKVVPTTHEVRVRLYQDGQAAMTDEPPKPARELTEAEIEEIGKQVAAILRPLPWRKRRAVIALVAEQLGVDLS